MSSPPRYFEDRFGERKSKSSQSTTAPAKASDATVNSGNGFLSDRRDTGYAAKGTSSNSTQNVSNSAPPPVSGNSPYTEFNGQDFSFGSSVHNSTNANVGQHRQTSAAVQQGQSRSTFQSERKTNFEGHSKNPPQVHDGNGPVPTKTVLTQQPPIESEPAVAAQNAVNSTGSSKKNSSGENLNPSEAQNSSVQSTNAAASVDAKSAKADTQKTTSPQKATESVASSAAVKSTPEETATTARKPNVFSVPGDTTATINPGNGKAALSSEKPGKRSNENATDKTGKEIEELSNDNTSMSDRKDMVLSLYGDVFGMNNTVKPISLKAVQLKDVSTDITLDQAREYFPWIGLFHPQETEIHKHLPYMAMVYNEKGGWDKQCILLLAGSETLAEQMKWEIRVALFFRRPRDTLRTTLFDSLSAAPKSEALLVIALHTAHTSQEVVLAPAVGSNLSGFKLEDVLLSFTKWMKSMVQPMKQAIAEAEESVAYTSRRLRILNTQSSSLWNRMSEDERTLFTDLAKSRVLIYQLENSVPYVSRHTGLIHVRNQRWNLSVDESIDFHPLVECVPLLNTLNASPLYAKLAYNAQDEILQLFLSSVSLTHDVDGKSRTLVLNSVARPDNFVPFEMLFSQEQASQITSFMHSFTEGSGEFYFTSAPVPKNESKSFFSIEGIVDACRLRESPSFTVDPIALSVSEIASVFKGHASFQLSTSQLSKAETTPAATATKSTLKKTPAPECQTQ